jgi:opacity protein-like surface antigen
MNRKHLLSMVAAVGLMASANARAADDSGFYFGTGMGEVTNEANGFDGDGIGVKFFGGYAFSKYFAAEVEYLDAGTLTDTVDGVNLAVESDGVVVSALGKLPLGEVISLFARLGYTFYDEKVTAKRGDLSLTEKNSDEDLLYGIGAELNAGSRIQLRAEYEIIDVRNADFNVLSASAVFRF